jgi:drug/metabolite transporter (DMT)-like permease
MQNFVSKIPGQVYLWLAILIFGASSSITRKLTEIGAMSFTSGDNPVSFCNVLFVGNLCALGIMLIVYRGQLIAKNFRKISKSEWFSLLVVALFSGALAPAAIFQALAISSVNNIVLLGRLEVPLALILSGIFLKERLYRNQKIGSAIMLVGIMVAVLGDNPIERLAKFTWGQGELLTISAAAILAISSLVNKAQLQHIPLGINSVVRTAIGSVIFFWVAMYFYGSNHFVGLFSPFLWQWMLLYGGIIVVIGQSLWLKGAKESPVSVSAIISCFHPIAAMLFSYWILAELPTVAQVIGSAVILVGLFYSQMSKMRDKGSLTSKGFEGI